MSVVRIQTGATEPIEVLAVDSLRAPLIGLVNLEVRIRRYSNGEYFDWSDSTFKASPTNLYTILQPVDSTRSPGSYYLNTAPHLLGFNTSAIVNPNDDDTYRIVVEQLGTPQNATNAPWEGEIKVGDWTDYIDEPISDQASPTEVRAELTNFGLDHLVSVNPGIVPPAAGTYIRQLLDNQDQIISSLAQGYSLQQNWSYNRSLNELKGQVWVEAFDLTTAVSVVSASVTWYDETETALFTVTDAAPDSRGVFLLVKANPGFSTNKPYYAQASVVVAGVGTVKGIKGAYTIGS